MQSLPRIALPIAASILAVVVVVAVAGFTQGNGPTPARVPAQPAQVQVLAADVAAAVTVTPTPRVIAVPETPVSSTAAAEEPPPPLPTLSPDPTSPIVTVATAPAAPAPTTVAVVALPTETLAARTVITTESTSEPLPTAASRPQATTLPTISAAPPTPSPTAPPTSTALPPEETRAVEIEFRARDWVEGFFRGDSEAYGRPWVAVYGAFSPYPRASLRFALDGAPDGPATLTIVGLDDEWAARNEIALEVNGQTLFAGPSPFADWDGVGNGADAAWTAVPFPIAPGTLRAGENTIVVSNLTQAGNFDAPPYVLLAETTIQFGGAADVGAAPARARERDKERDDGQKVKPAKENGNAARGNSGKEKGGKKAKKNGIGNGNGKGNKGKKR